jgi:MFS family permease
MRGLCAVFFFFFANLSFYLVMTLFMQNGLHIAPLLAGLVFVPLALAFVVASRHSAERARHRGTRVLIEGCAVQITGLAALAVTVASVAAPSAPLLVVPLILFGYGQGLVMAPLSGAVLATVPPVSAGSGSGMYGTTAQIANAAGVAAIGAVYFAVQSAGSARMALLASFAACALSVAGCAGLLLWMRRVAKP